VYRKPMLHRMILLLTALALLPAVPAMAEESQTPPASGQAPKRSDAQRETRPESERKVPRARAPPPAKKHEVPPPAPGADAKGDAKGEAKGEAAPAKPAAQGEKPCVPVKPCAID
jgi:hypothetical protein